MRATRVKEDGKIPRKGGQSGMDNGDGKQARAEAYELTKPRNPPPTAVPPRNSSAPLASLPLPFLTGSSRGSFPRSQWLDSARDPLSSPSSSQTRVSTPVCCPSRAQHHPSISTLTGLVIF